MPRNDSHTDQFQTPAVARGRGPRPDRPRRRPRGIRPSAESLEDRHLLASVLSPTGVPGQVGYFPVDVGNGGHITQSQITVIGKSGQHHTIDDALNEFINYVDVGAGRSRVRLARDCVALGKCRGHIGDCLWVQ